MAYITLNKTHFFNNLDIIAQLTCAKDKIALVLKDNAYGHGLLEIAQLAQEYGITKVVVRSNAEAEAIEHLFEYILVLGDTSQKPSEKIRYTINDIAQIEKFARGIKVELKVNSGMNRNGVEMDELATAFKMIQVQGLELEAVFTHHSSADEESEFYELQKSNFEQIKKEAKALANEYDVGTLRFHSCNSAALFREEKLEDDMVRVGIAAYGCMELENSQAQKRLRPILSLYAQKISSRLLKEGECVGYSATYKADVKCVVSNYDCGYGDGFLRTCSNEYVTPQNIHIAGRISMDNSSFLSEAEELLIFNDARVAAKYAKTISYEVLTSLKAYIKRKIIADEVKR